MRRIIKKLTLTGLSGLLCLFLAIPANAQHRGSFGGGGGGRSGGGFSGGGGRSGGGFSGGGGRSFGGGSSAGGRQSFGGNIGGGSRQSFGGGRSYNNISPGVGRQSFGGGRVQGLQGNTRAFSNRTGVYGNRGAVTGRVGVNGYRGAFNGRYGVTSRVAPRFYGRNYYRGGIGNYGRGYSYSPWSRRGGYFYNRGFYRSYYYPRLGFTLGYLPYGYYPFLWGGLQFYYSDGYFYQYDNNQYTVVEPPIGAAVNTLPSGAQSIVINGVQYYELNGVYYEPITRDDGSVVYQVAGKDGQLETDEPNLNDYNGDNGAPAEYYNQPGASVNQGPQIGDVVNSLPADTRKIKIDGEKYIVSPDDYYYQETRDSNGNKVYEIVGVPGDNPGEN